ncbi:alpha/beta hydrolase family protein [Lentzea nigeriaca]|uniref:alpha/beta hydrolase family protein n=1 Tax=Lentzea nigeriaca TaxID=1128665 RepID=UPI001958DD03|nr:prolyl oligopeptidase family serine peptidase [Lentzea nigeriaca]MBM7858918.1 pimeloyl-ACP methyl ester carboxylesterase [Lentzea nigeriaca]
MIPSAAALVVLLVGGTFWVSWWASSQQIVPDHGQHLETVLAVKDAGAGKDVVVTANTKTARHRGTYWLSWDGGWALMGDIVSQTADSVERRLLDGALPTIGAGVYVGGAMPSDPKTTLGLDYSEVMVPTELGPAPAWYVPATGPDDSTWVIGVHGQNGRRKAVMPIAPVVHRLGLPMLAITYRNDEGAPASPDGLLHLGGSEWQDVESAVRFAQEHGARRVVLLGESNGGQIVGQFLARSPLAGMTASIVLDAPTTSMLAVSAYVGGEQYGAPRFAVHLTDAMMGWRTGVDFEHLDLIKYPPAVKPPALVLQGDADTEAPAQMNRDFAEAGKTTGWQIQYEEFPGADHVESWNSDRQRYENLVADFLTRTIHTP